MSVRKRQREILGRVGFHAVEYFVDGWPPVWGTALIRAGEEVCVIETSGPHTNDDRLYNRYVLRDKRGGKELAVHKLKRNALASAVGRFA